ncbi:GIY-YIG nuclease family protein [bacterium]|nr:GIY-YIG nuclease family protein [bacterium]
MGKISLYRHYDKEDNLLYVGISLSSLVRWQQHNNNSHWAKDSVTMTTEWFDTRELALDAERTAIRSEKPLHNIKHAKADSKENNKRIYTIDNTLLREVIECVIENSITTSCNIDFLAELIRFSNGGFIHIDKSLRGYLDRHFIKNKCFLKTLIKDGVLTRVRKTNTYKLEIEMCGLDEFLEEFYKLNVKDCEIIKSIKTKSFILKTIKNSDL